MALGDIYQVTFKQSYKGLQDCLNVYYYRLFAGYSNSADLLLNEFSAIVADTLKLAQSDDISQVSLEAKNLFNLADTANLAYPPTRKGTRAGSSEPPFVQVAVQYLRTTATMRHGWKRYVGIPESDVEDGQIVTSALVFWQNVAVAGQTTLTATGTVDTIFEPVVVKRIKYTTSEGKTAYRLPEYMGEANYFHVDQYVLKTYVSSQVSRKVGRGS